MTDDEKEMINWGSDDPPFDENNETPPGKIKPGDIALELGQSIEDIVLDKDGFVESYTVKETFDDRTKRALTEVLEQKELGKGLSVVEQSRAQALGPAPVAEVTFETPQEKMLGIALQKGDEKAIKLIYELYERNEADQRKVKFHAAFSRAQGKFDKITKNRTANLGAGRSYGYADLEELLRATRPALNEQGLSIYTASVPESEQKAGHYTTRCVISGFGHEQVSEFTVSTDIMSNTYANEAQRMGAVRTYAVRYAYYDALGVFPTDEDSDASNNAYAAKATHAAKKSAATTSKASFSQPVQQGKAATVTKNTAEKPPAQTPVTPAGMLRNLELMIADLETNPNPEISEENRIDINETIKFIKEDNKLPSDEVRARMVGYYRIWKQSKGAK